MKKIKIRFVEVLSSNGTRYLIQNKNVFGRWQYMGYWVNMGYGSAWNEYVDDSKEKLMDTVLEKAYQRPRSQVQIIEYPMIKIY
jgi:hypothetical protein